MRIAILTAVFLSFFSAFAQAGTKRIVALGDSLTAGYGLKAGEDYGTQLQTYLKDKGLDVRVDNAGVSGDTSAGGLARVDWATAGDPAPSLVIVAFGGNDLLRGIEPAVMESNLRGILQKLKTANIPAILYGMKAPLNLPTAYRQKFDAVYARLADEFDVPLYPFFLDGVAMDPALNIEDGVHPNTQGIAVMVARTGPLVVDLIAE